MLCETTLRFSQHIMIVAQQARNKMAKNMISPKFYVCWCGLCATCDMITICRWDNFICIVEVSHICWCMCAQQAHPKNVCFLETNLFPRKFEKNSPILLMYGVLLGAWCANIKFVSEILPKGHVVYSYLILES